MAGLRLVGRLHPKGLRPECGKVWACPSDFLANLPDTSLQATSLFNPLHPTPLYYISTYSLYAKSVAPQSTQLKREGASMASRSVEVPKLQLSPVHLRPKLVSRREA